MNWKRVCFAILTIVVCDSSSEMTKSWQPRSLAESVTVQNEKFDTPVKINDKLFVINKLRGNFPATKPPQKANLKVEKSGGLLIGGFENNVAKDRRRANFTKPIAVNNKLDTIRSRMEHFETLPKYEIGPGLNLTLDIPREIVNVNLDEEYLKDVFLGRGRKHMDIVLKILPLFIIPFLIQSAIIPFMLSSVKLLLVKSILIGKTAIFLIILSALKNLYKNSHIYEVPLYNYDPPLRRSEMIPPGGYKVDGSQAWMN